MKKITAAWARNPKMGAVTGELITKPQPMGFLLETYRTFIATAMIKDSHGRKWRVKTKGVIADEFMQCTVGQSLKLTGIKGDLCKGAFDNAKRQIVLDSMIALTNECHHNTNLLTH